MVQAFKLFCVATSALLFLQLADAAENEKTSSENESKDPAGKEEQAVFLKNVANATDSRPARVVKELTSIAGEKLNTFSNDFQATLNADSKNQVKDENSFVPNGVTNNVILPAKALVKTGYKKIEKPVTNIISDVKNSYTEELAKADQNEDFIPIVGTYAKKPVAFLKASKHVVKNTVGGIFRKASALGKNRKSPQNIS